MLPQPPPRGRAEPREGLVRPEAALQVLTRGAEPVTLCRLWVPTPPALKANLPHSARCVILKPHHKWQTPACGQKSQLMGLS